MARADGGRRPQRAQRRDLRAAAVIDSAAAGTGHGVLLCRRCLQLADEYRLQAVLPGVDDARARGRLLAVLPRQPLALQLHEGIDVPAGLGRPRHRISRGSGAVSAWHDIQPNAAL